MTQKLDQMTATALSSTPTNTITATLNSFPSAFEQTEIKPTLIKTALKSEQLTHIPDLLEIPSSTRRIKPLNNFLGQDRARASVEAGISLPYSGYNIFAVGTAGLGKRTMIKRLLQQHAKTMQTPDDWVYVNNFKNPRQPIALRFPAGQGTKFQNALQQAWQVILKQLERRFSAESYHNRIERIRQATGEVQQQALVELTKEGEDLDLKLISRNDKHVFIPMQLRDDEYHELTQEDIDTLSNKERAEITSNIRYMEKKLDRLGLHLGDLEDDARDQVSSLNREIATQVVMPRVDLILNKNKEVKGLEQFLKQYADDIIDNVELILEQEEDDFTPALFNRVPSRYQANVIVSNKPNSGAPVIFEDFPTHYNLLGHVEQLTHNGTITTDFTLIRPGSLHQANGGFLMLEAEHLLEQPYAWQGLKRALKSGQLKLSSLEHMLTLTGSISIEPASVPLDLKVILLAEPEIYYEILEVEPELGSVFKIRADFTDTLQRNDSNEQAYMQLIADYVQADKLLPFDRSALAALLTDSSRQAEDQSSLSLHASTLGDLIREAHHHAFKSCDKIVTDQHVNQALHHRQYRLGYLRELYWQDLSRGTQLIETSGHRLGQINALSVIHYADVEFGLPSRLTASVYQGGGDILDIERSVELGGSLHAKGVLLMSSFLKAHFGREQILHFSAALAFEQSYGQVDGDSATVAELSALISAICQIPIDQSWAITGSMNQLGQVQPIGGVNAKIEGFYDACKLQGLTGKQGVIIPRQNMQHLMLRQDVIDAVESGQFHVHAIDTIDQALEILMARPVGTLDKKGRYSKNSIYAAVMEQLEYWQAIEDGEAVEEDEPKKKKKRKKSKKDETDAKASEEALAEAKTLKPLSKKKHR
ncbi:MULTISPECIES: ATP-binding protein [Acinetobacter]|uniref:Lon protease family protein n=1 Tax=Acinetobacter TaxID=469 RepID=UPI000C47F642|nr:MULTISPECIES: ATP-binding protein [Acinetobacter]MBC69255.1 ATP-dependent protease [Acinetobacter sp.]MBT51024.1 ATP-dependent protease [Acinetobacter sp.]HIQ34786.1 ATP-binding protein [Acinetobacter venetianus]HJP49007.1 ATP-binding protein [Acinetobacter venetianus]